MMQGSSQARVLITIKRKGDLTKVKVWTGRNVARVRKAAKAHYSDSKVTCRLLGYVNSYGAH